MNSQPTLLTPAQFRAATAAVLMTILLSALDQTIVSVAVPTISRQLGGFEWMAWVISGYLIASTIVTPLYGRFSDLIGRRKVMMIAIVIFLLASVACALARSMPQLVIARVLQGAGGGGLIATAQSVIADVVPVRERGRYQAYISVVWAVASMLGPVVGGVLTDYLSWPWIFWINLPFGLVALRLVHTSLKSLPVQRAAVRIDGVGALLLLTGLSAFLVPITRVGQGTPWTDGGNLVGWAIAAVLLALFVPQQRRHPYAIVPLGLFQNRVIIACCALLFICYINFISMSVLVPLRLQLSAGFSAADAALRLMPLTLAIPFAAFVGGRWISRTGRLLPVQRLGAILVPLALAALGFGGPTGALNAVALIVLGLGTGLQMPTVLITVQQSAPPGQIGTATALTAFFRLLGGAIGIAVLSSILLTLLRSHLPAGAQSLNAEGLGRLIDAAHDAGRAVSSTDDAFQRVMLLSALVSCLSIWWVSWLPDLHLHDKPPSLAEASAAEL